MFQNLVNGEWVDGVRKGSSHGPREQGRCAAQFYTALKTAYTQA